MADADLDQRIRDIQREYLDFLDDEADQGVYITLIKDMISNGENRLIININDLRRKNNTRAQALLQSGFEEQVAFCRALKDVVANADSNYSKKHDEFFVGFEGSFGPRHVTPRTLNSSFLGNMICVEGIVTKCSLVRPKVVRSVHYCPSTQKTIERRYTDLTSYDPVPTSAVYPTKDEDGNLLETEFGLSSYKDHQTLTIQEMPEQAPAGQLPRSVDIVCDNDLVDKCKPGDRVQIVGSFRCLPSKQGGFTSGTFRTIVIANHIAMSSKDANPNIYVEDVKKCKRLKKQKGRQIFNTLAASLAPSIHGHEFVKKALLCLLLGGVEKLLPNGTRLRGDINVLLIGDPSVAKSQLLRYVMNISSRAVSTTGRGSSGVGLTAAVTTDQETGERRLEAGTMVLADRGVVCIDEFDKMSDIDRTAIHEVMEQGRVTISKAGIHARLNARCSVLAAANPVYGRYDQYKTPMENIGLQDSLLSRFDLLFILLDSIDQDNDRYISDHVVRMHRYRSPNEQDGEALQMGSSVDRLTTGSLEEQEDDDDKTPVYEKYDALLHGGSRTGKDKVLSMKFMQKYIFIAKTLKPTLTKEVCEAIAEEYSRLRTQDTEHTDVARTQPVTARTLETLIRLSTAHAKARLSSTVDIEDAEEAIELVQFAYFKRVLEREKRKRRRDDGASGSEGEDNDDDDDGADKTPDAPKSPQPPKPKKQRNKPGDEGYDPYEFSSGSESEKVRSLRQKPVTATPEDAQISDERLTVFRSGLIKLFKEQHAQSLPMNRVREFLAAEHGSEPFTGSELSAAVTKMTEANQVMLADDILFLI